MSRPLIDDGDLQIHVGDALDVLRTLPDASVDCIATSPPFFGLRDYQVDGQIGLEPDPETWAVRLVAVFREARRVLADHGTLWIECGDSYAGSARAEKPIPDATPHELASERNYSHPGSNWANYNKPGRVTGSTGDGLKPKDLIGQPFLLAFALRADGWYWRGCNIWAKPNAMPESAKDRCTVAHSYVLHFSKKPRYFFDGDAIAEPAAWERWGDQTVPKHEGTATAAGWIPARPAAELRYGRVGAYQNRAMNGTGDGTTPTRRLDPSEVSAKHPRSVWTISTQGFPGAHFATWPEKLAERIILASCPAQVCGTCGKPRERIVAATRLLDGEPYEAEAWPVDAGGRRLAADGVGHWRKTIRREHRGFSDCGHGNYRPGTILDPFAGSGTTGLVARRHGRHAVLIELSENYARMAAERCQQLSLLAQETP